MFLLESICLSVSMYDALWFLKENIKNLSTVLVVEYCSVLASVVGYVKVMMVLENMLIKGTIVLQGKR